MLVFLERPKRYMVGAACLATLGAMGLAGCGDDEARPAQVETAQNPALEDCANFQSLGDIIDYYDDQALPGEDWTDHSLFPTYAKGQFSVEFRHVDGRAACRSTHFQAQCVGSSLVTTLFRDATARKTNPDYPDCEDSLDGPGVLYELAPNESIINDRDILVQMPDPYVPAFER